MKKLILIFTYLFYSIVCMGQEAVSVPNKNPNSDYKRSGNDKTARPVSNSNKSAYEQARHSHFNAHSLPKVDSKLLERSSFQFSVGTCLPMSEFGRKAFGTNFNEANQNGAKAGVALQANYHFYLTSFFGLGVLVGANFFGYDKDNASNYILEHYGEPEVPYALVSSSSWRDINFGLSLLLRIPLSERLYLTGNASARFLLLNSPALDFQYTGTVPQDTTKAQERLNLNWENNSAGTVAFGGGLGLFFRLTQNISILLNADYLYAFAPTTQYYFESLEKKIRTYPVDSDIWTKTITNLSSSNIKQNYSNLSITLGVSYAF